MGSPLIITSGQRDCITVCPNRRMQKVRPGTAGSPDPSLALTDNALVSSGERLPSGAAVGVETWIRTRWACERQVKSHTLREACRNTLEVFLSFQDDQNYTSNPGAWGSDVEVNGLDTGNREGSETSKHCLSSTSVAAL